MTFLRKCIKATVVDTKVFIYIAIFVFLLDEILAIHTLIGGFLKIFIAWGMIIIALNVWKDKQEIKNNTNKYFIFLVLFSVSYGITIYVNRESHVVNNIKIWAYMIVFFAVLYGLKKIQTKEQWNKEVYQLLNYIMVLTFLLSAVCMFTYIFEINIPIKEPDGYSHIGMYDNRLWGVYNPNVGSTLNVISVISTLGVLFGSEIKKKRKLILLIANLVLQYLHLLLTGSRTSLFTLLLGVAIFIFFFYKTKKKMVICLALSGMTAILMMAAYSPVREGLSYIPGIVKKEVAVKKQKGSQVKKKIDLVRKEKEENREGGALTGRQYLWTAGIKALKEQPLFGVSKAATYDKAKKYIEDKFWLLSLESSLHNIYITVLVASGIIGFVIFMIFLCLNIKDYIKIVLYRKENNQIYISLLIIIAMLMLTECLEGRIVYRTEVFNVLFWSFMGYASQYTRITEREKTYEISTEEV